MGVAASPRGPGRGWWLALAVVWLAIGLAFHEGLAGTAAIDAAAYLHYTDPLYGGPRPAPVPLFDPSPELLYQPWDTFMMACFRQGELPLWFPDNGCGAPLLANGQSAPFNPFKWLFLFGRPATGVPEAWFLVSRLFVAAAGVLVLARRLGRSPAAGALAALGFVLSGFWLYHLHFADTSPLVLLPWLVWAAERLVARPDARNVAILGLLTGLAGLQGHPETALFSAAAAFLAAAIGLATRPRGLFALAGAGVLGVGVAGVAVVPFAGYVRESLSYLFDRAHSAFAGLEYLFGFGIGLKQFEVHVFAPDAAGSVGHYNAFAGVVVPALVPFGLATRDTWRPAAALVAVWAIAYLLFPPSALVHWLPTAPNSFYATPLLSLALALLAAAGLDAVAASALRPAEARTRGRLLAGVAQLLVMGAAWQLARTAGGRPEGYHVFMAAGMATVLLGLAASRLSRAAVAWGLVAVCAVQLGLAAREAVPPLPVGGYTETPVTRFLAANAHGERIAGGVPRPDAQAMFGLSAFEMIDAFINQRYFAFYGALHAGPHPIGNMLFTGPDFRPGVLDLANVGYLVAPAGPLATAAAGAGYPVAFRDGGLAVYRNPRVLPRARVVYAADFEGVDLAAAARRLGSAPARYRDRALVETPDGRPPAGWPATEAAPTPATIVARGPNHVVVRARLARPGLLLLAETVADGWEADVDGHPAPIYPADVLFRAVPLAAGEHVTTFRYRPRGVKRGIALTLVALAVGLLLALWPRWELNPARRAG